MSKKQQTKAGRKTSEDVRRHRHNVMMSADTITLLKQYGNGNISEGIRWAATHASGLKRV